MPMDSYTGTDWVPEFHPPTAAVTGAAVAVRSRYEQVPKSPVDLRLEFRGSAREYFRIWIVNLCLTLLTCGIFSAWAKVRKKRYMYSHTLLDGTPFQYLGKPIPILKGRLIAAAGFLIYYAATHFFTSLLPYVIAAGAIAAPWVIVRSAAFNARYSAFRNITFHFHASYKDAFNVLYAWGIIPALIIPMVFSWRGKEVVLGIVSLVFAVLFPWWMKRFKKFIIERTSYGGKTGTFSATGWQFCKIYLLSGLIVLAVSVPMGALAGLVFYTKITTAPLVFLLPVYTGYVLSFAYVKARIGNLVWNSTAVGPIRLRSTLRWGGLLKLYVTNALGIIVSLGLLIPWAVLRTVQYRADHMYVSREGELSEFEGSGQGAVTAVGEGMADIFEVDLSI
ncbi:MAG: YjgN family protein [Syntrophobacter sp.]